MTRAGAARAAWPLLAAAFVSGLAVALLLAPGGADHDAPASPAARSEAPEATGAAAVDVAGPTAVVEGVPVGFARTEAGAVAAAASFVCTGQALLDMSPQSAERAIRELAAAASADELVSGHLDQLAGAREVLAAGNGPIVYRQSAIAWRVQAYDRNRARVAIWNVGVLSREGVAPPQAGWATSVVDLVWERDDWRVWGETVTPGPTPIADDSDAPATSAELHSGLDGFTDFGASR